MMAAAARIAWKDVRQHSAWIGVYLVVVLLRALLVGSGIDAAIRDHGALTSLALAYRVVCGLHLALIVTLAVQVVQGDRLVGTTAFWLTRPVARGSLLAAKLALGFGFVVAVPVLVDVVVVLRYGLSGIDALGAAAEGALLRTGLLLPLMALAAVTADLAVFVVSAIAGLFATVVAETLLQWLKLVFWKGNDLGETLTVVAVIVIGLGALASFAHQVFTRRTRRSALVLVGSVALMLVAVNRVERPFALVPESLEPGWIDASRVAVTLTPAAPQRLPFRLRQDRTWQIPAACEISGAPPNVVLGPFAFSTTLTLADGTADRYDSILQTGWSARWTGARLARKEKVERILGGIRLLNAEELVVGKTPTRPITVITQDVRDRFAARGGRLDVEAVVGALAYKACEPVPLRPGARGRCGDRLFAVQSAEFSDGACLVDLRDVEAGFIIDLRRQSGVVYVLVNRAKGAGIVGGARDFDAVRQMFGAATVALLGEHVSVTHRDLVFQAPKDAPDAVGPDWLTDAMVVPVEVRDIGNFTVKAKVAGY